MPKLSMFPPKPSIFKHLSHLHLHLHLPPPMTLSPNSSFPLSRLADECTSMTQLKQVHAQMIISGRIKDNYAASRLLSFSALSGFGDINYAVTLFNSTNGPNNFMYNTMIRALASSVKPCNALLLFVEMRRVGVLPGKHTFPFVLKACLNMRPKSVSECLQIHCHVVKFGLDLDLHVVNGLVRGYSVGGDLDDARQLFDEMPERNLCMWTSMVCGYAQNNHSNEALLVFNQMVDEGFEPNGATLASVLSACAREGCLDLGERIEKFMSQKGIKVGVILCTALVDMHAKNGAMSKARDVFDKMPEKNIATWNAMIRGLAVHGHGFEALSLFQKLEIEKMTPTRITIVAALSACCHGGFLEKGREIFHSMKTHYNIEPQLEHYGCMVDLLGRAGKLIEAEDLIRCMTWKADVMIWGALLTACRKCGNIEVAERVVKEIIALDPQNHGVRVVLSNMYAEVGRWEEVSKLRKVMKEENLKKIAGSSLVDGGD